MFGLSFQELFIVGVVAILLFGRNLPNVARSMGQSYQQFRKGLHDLQSQLNMNDLYDTTPSTASRNKPKPRRSDDDDDDRDEITAPKFVPPPAEPQSRDTDAA
jgi:sec-independent protein translocase protein TatA